MFDFFGLEIVHTDGRRETAPWRFATTAELRSAFHLAEGEDPSVSDYRIVEPDERHPVWGEA